MKKYGLLVAILVCLTLGIWAVFFALIFGPGVLQNTIRPSISSEPAMAVVSVIPSPIVISDIPPPILTPSCILAPKEAWDKTLAREDGAWIGRVVYGNSYLNLSVNVLAWAGVGYGAEVTIENSPQGALLHISPLSFRGVDSGGRICDLSAWQWEWEQALQATDLEPGTHTSGRVILDCPEADPLAYIIYDDGITAPPIMINVGEVIGCH